MKNVLCPLLTDGSSRIAKVWRHSSRGEKGHKQPGDRIYAIFQYISQVFMAIGSSLVVRFKIRLTCEGLDNVPRRGSVLIVARHFHHFYDGCIFLGIIPRRIHIFVALDWIQKRWVRRLMEFACALLGWPVVLRNERLRAMGAVDAPERRSTYAPGESRRYLVQAFTMAVRQLRNGEVLAIFPEAYPNIDPAFTPKQSNEAFLPFKAGFAKIVEMAERDRNVRVAIVPTGLSYVYKKRWQAKLRFGEALFLSDYATVEQLVQVLEKQVYILSLPVLAIE